MRSVKIRSNNPMPTSDDVGHQLLIDLWSEVEAYFEKAVLRVNENGTIKLAIDASEIKQMLWNTDPARVDEFFQFLHEKEKGKFPSSPFASSIDLRIVGGEFDSNAVFDAFVARFIGTLFLAMNLCSQSGCNLIYLTTFDQAGRPIDLGDMSDYIVEGAWHRSAKDQWPTLKRLPFVAVWEWLLENGALTYVLAETPASKAIAVLTELSYGEHLRLTDIVQLSHVLESLLLTKDEPRGRGIRRKAQAVLGSSAKADAWANKFYKLRSEIVHGDYPVFYPRYSSSDADFEALSSHYWEVNGILLQGVAVVIALLQDLISSNTSRYQFEEKLEFVRKV